VVAATGLTLAGSGASRSIAVTAVPGASGTTTITLGASDGLASAAASFTVTVVPRRGAPSGLAAVTARNAVTFTWAAPPASLEPVTGFVLEAGLAPGAPFFSQPLGLATTFSVTAPDGVFFVRVRSETTGGTSRPSNEVRIATGEAGPPLAPLALLATVRGLDLALQWTENPLGPDVTSYRLIAGTAPGAADVGTVPLAAGVTRFAAAAGGGPYFVRVAAANAAGVGPVSNEFVLAPGAGRPAGRQRRAAARRRDVVLGRADHRRHPDRLPPARRYGPRRLRCRRARAAGHDRRVRAAAAGCLRRAGDRRERLR
jgi:hypothetical protein